MYNVRPHTNKAAQDLLRELTEELIDAMAEHEIGPEEMERLQHLSQIAQMLRLIEGDEIEGL